MAYSWYIWPCYALLLAVLVAHIISAMRISSLIRKKIIRAQQVELVHD